MSKHFWIGFRRGFTSASSLIFRLPLMVLFAGFVLAGGISFLGAILCAAAYNKMWSIK